MSETLTPVHIPLDLTSIEDAVHASELGSFRRAAAMHHVRPSVVSRRIRNLEDVLGVSLFQRGAQGAKPTDAGLRVLKRARSILDELRHLIRSARTRGLANEGTLRVGIVSSISGSVGRRLLETFFAAHPEVHLDIHEGSHHDQIAAVATDNLDVAFVPGTPATHGCESERVWSERIMVAMPIQHRLAGMAEIAWTDIASEHILVTQTAPGPEVHEFILRHMVGLGHRPYVDAQPVSRETLLTLVGLQRGIALVGEAAATITYSRVTFRPLKGELLTFSMIWSATTLPERLRRALTWEQTAEMAQQARLEIDTGLAIDF
ncbi:MAG: LysR family transcriptional regulator, partial [Acetobacteraceae bacterium]|nr:LysR family transcriptional regulator [Acetobacteraceae bacterium]